MIKTQVKNVVKTVRQAVETHATDAATTTLDTAKSMITKAAKKGVIHRKTHPQDFRLANWRTGQKPNRPVGAVPVRVAGCSQAAPAVFVQPQAVRSRR